MDTLSFLQSVWPASGIYCLANPIDGGGYRHKTFTSIDDTARWIADLKNPTNVFFNVHTLKEHKVWNEAKQKDQVRVQTNMDAARCFFFDLDVGESTATSHKYATRQEALDGLEAFLFRTHLPTPLITSSGGGYHVYWLLSDPIPSTEWRSRAAELHHIARKLGLRADPARTTDQSSVLRVVRTWNVKPGRDPSPCEAIEAGYVVTPTQDFCAQLTELLGTDTIPEQKLRDHTLRKAKGNLAPTWDGPIRTVGEVAEVCDIVRTYQEHGHQPGSEPWLYYVGAGLIQFLENGEDLHYELASKHPHYDEARAQAKLEAWPGGAVSCATLKDKCGGDACAKCPFTALGTNPIAIATEHFKRKALPAPEPESTDNPNEGYICDPPFPYSRTKAGITMKTTRTLKNGTEIEDSILLCKYDIYPCNSCECTELEQAFSEWMVDIPLVGKRKLKIRAGELTDAKALHLALVNKGVNINSKQAAKVSEMMTSWLRGVQETIAANPQFDHLGWVDDKRTAFILPTALLKADGTSHACTLSASAKNGLDFVTKKGTLEKQIELMQFYNHPRYIKHQFVIMCGLAAPMFHATNQSGMVVNASGDTGGSKSTAMETAASFWGRPKGYVINGTEGGMTTIARLNTIHTLCNLPICVDEITHLSHSQAQALAFGSSQEGGRVRSARDGNNKAQRGGIKSTILICTGNKQLHELLSVGNSAGTASHMRVFEMFFPTLDGGADEANKYIEQMYENYGHIGPEFLRRYLVQRVEIDNAVRRVISALNTKFGMKPAERYWAAVIATAMIAGECARVWGLLPFDERQVLKWVIDEQLPLMRGQVTDEYNRQLPLEVLSNFVYDKINQILTIDQAGFAHHPPHGGLVGERVHNKAIHIIKSAFREWCDERQISGLRVLKSLSDSRYVMDVDRKRLIGQGTSYGSIKATTFTVDLTNPEVAGAMQESNVLQFPNLRKGLTQ